MIPAERIAQNIGKSKSRTKALLKSGFAPHTARTQQKRILERPDVRELIAKYGPNLKKAFKVTNDLMEANKIVTSPTEEDKEYPDWAARAKGSDQAYKVHNIYSETTQTQPTSVIFNINLDDPQHQHIGTIEQVNLVSATTLQDTQLAPESPQDELGDGQTNR